MATIVASKSAIMMATGAGQRLTVRRRLGAERYEPDWPATVIHECAVREILSDADAAA